MGAGASPRSVRISSFKGRKNSLFRISPLRDGTIRCSTTYVIKFPKEILSSQNFRRKFWYRSVVLPKAEAKGGGSGGAGASPRSVRISSFKGRKNSLFRISPLRDGTIRCSTTYVIKFPKEILSSQNFRRKFWYRSVVLPKAEAKGGVRWGREPPPVRPYIVL